MTPKEERECNFVYDASSQRKKYELWRTKSICAIGLKSLPDQVREKAKSMDIKDLKLYLAKVLRATE